MDDPFVQCPYDKQHLVPKSRLQAHIVRCQEKYPKLEICPYNATHRMPKNDFKDHTKNCPSKDDVFPPQLPKVTGNIKDITYQPTGPVKLYRDNVDEWDD